MNGVKKVRPYLRKPDSNEWENKYQNFCFKIIRYSQGVIRRWIND